MEITDAGTGAAASAARSLGEGIDAASRGIDRLVARLEDVSGHAFAPASELLSGPLARRRAEYAMKVFGASGAELTEADRRAIAYSSMRSMKGFENVQETIALVNIGDPSKVEEVEDEWLSLFLDCAEGAFSEWKRRFLADAATTKAASPRDLPLGSLHAISRMERMDMDAFEAVCSLRVNEPYLEGHPVVLCLDDDILSIVGLSSESVMRLCDIGVLRRRHARVRKNVIREDIVAERGIDSMHEHPVTQRDDFSLRAKVRFSTRTATIIPMRIFVNTITDWENDVCIDFGEFEFAEAGKGMASIIDAETAERVEEYLAKGYAVVSARESRERSDGMFDQRNFERAVRKVMSRTLR